jgi:hypothetical protein
VRTCARCGVTQEDEQFFKYTPRQATLHSVCLNCRRQPCACGCGQLTTGFYNGHRRELPIYIWQHHYRGADYHTLKLLPAPDTQTWPIKVIHCAGNNRRFGEIAVRHGLLYGAQMPSKVYYQLYFCDQNWKKPQRARYLECLAKYRPYMATVLDWEREEQFDEVMDWAEGASEYVQVVVIIPKLDGVMDRIPEKVGKASVRIGYSVPTRYGKTEVPLAEFGVRPVHLLGGTPAKQMELCTRLNVQSVDGNILQMVALRHCRYWSGGGWHRLETHDGFVETDAPYKAFELSCANVLREWDEFFAQKLV